MEPNEGEMTETSGSTTISTKLERIAKLAKSAPSMPLTTLAHHMDVEWLREAYRRTRKDAATWTAGGWVIELDIRKYFESIDHERLREALHQRVRDGVILRLIGKWLNAGVMEDGELQRREAGTPQGGVISPLLANIFLHG